MNPGNLPGIYSGKDRGRGRVCANSGRRNPHLPLNISLESQRKKKNHV